MRLIGRTRRLARKRLRRIPAPTKAARRRAVRQILPLSGAKAALSGCSMNTRQPVGSTAAHAVKTFLSPNVRPLAEPEPASEPSAFLTCGNLVRPRFGSADVASEAPTGAVGGNVIARPRESTA